MDYFKRKALDSYNKYSISAVLKYDPYINEYRFCFNRKGVTFNVVRITPNLMTTQIDMVFDEAYQFYNK